MVGESADKDIAMLEAFLSSRHGMLTAEIGVIATLVVVVTVAICKSAGVFS